MSLPYDRGQYNQRNITEREITLEDKYNTEEIEKSGHNLYKRRRLFDKGTKVGTTYVDSAIFDARFYKDKLFHITNKDVTNNLLYKILACINPSKWYELCPETTITPTEESKYEFDDGVWAFYKVQCKSSASTVELEVYACGQK